MLHRLVSNSWTQVPTWFLHTIKSCGKPEISKAQCCLHNSAGFSLDTLCFLQEGTFCEITIRSMMQ